MEELMNLVVLGAGYVGLTTSVCLAEKGHNVLCIDKDINKIEILNSGKATIYEEGMSNLLKKI